MYFKFIRLILSFFDSFNQKKIINFFKKNSENKIACFIDVGAHYGETIKIFRKNFEIENIIAFEPSPINYRNLILNTKNINNIKTFNIGLGSKEEKVDFVQHYESQSSTMTKINYESKYYKKKNSLLNFFNKKNIKLKNIKVNIDRLDNILNSIQVSKIDILKIDTEGNDFQVIKGMGDLIKDVKFIYFEHHFHNMLIKNYTLNNVHTYLTENNFKKVFKIKMFFRKTFEYIYCNKSLIK